MSTHRPDPEPADPQLAAEREHLAGSRRQLARMRERTAAMDSSAAGDWVSREYLESTFALRMKQLADDPTIPLFFGRLDMASTGATGSTGSTGSTGESWHIGRRHISDPTGEPMVIDWRAPVSLPFYRASRVEPMGVRRRRRFGFQHGSLTAYEDEDLGTGEVEEFSAILEAEIERPRTGPMRDIVATIQPEQDVIVRSDLARSVCVQGAPGTGKTAVGLHRAAYLLYAHREQLTRQGVLVVGPNASFLRYIRDVLPALGEIDATQSTIGELVARTLRGINPRWEVCGADSAAVATLKGDPRLAEVLRRALWSQVRAPAEGLVLPRGARRWRVAAYEAEELVESLRARGVRYGAARAMVPQSLAHRILVKMELAGDSPDDRVQDAVARSKPVKDYANAIWPAVEPARLVWRLLSDADFLAAAAQGLLDADEQALLRWDRPARSPASTRWSLADAVLVDETVDLVERTPSVGHIVADEAQDLSPMMLRALARRSSTGSLTVLGDLAQATTPWATRSLGRGAGPPRQARRPRRAAHPGLPGARRGDRVRRAAAAPHRAGPRAADVGAPVARRAGGGLDRPGRRRRRGRAGLRPRRRAGPGRVGRRDRARRPGRRGRRDPGGGRASASRSSAGTSRHPTRSPPSSTSTSTWCRPASRRAWSSTTSYCSSRPGSWPASRTGSPGCAASTSA